MLRRDEIKSRISHFDPMVEAITAMGQVAWALVVRCGQPVAHLSWIEANRSFTTLPIQAKRSLERATALNEIAFVYVNGT